MAEVAVELRISPKFTDDGAPEGTCERPLSIHIEEAEPEAVLDAEEGEQEIDLAGEFVRAFRD